MEDEIYATLMRYHREVLAPEFQRIHDRLDELDAKEHAHWDIMLGHFAAIHERFDRLELQYEPLPPDVGAE